MTARAECGRRMVAAIAAAVLTTVLGGCTTTEQVQTFVRDAYVYGPVMSPPVHVATERARNAMTISAYGVAQRAATFRGNVDGQASGTWRPQSDTIRQPPGTSLPREDTRTHNLFWYTPEYSGGVHFDIAWESFALSLGGAFAAHEGSTRMGWMAGVGFFTRETSAVRVRFDFGVFGQAMDFDARSMEITTRTTEWWGSSSRSVDTAYFFDSAIESGLGYYGSLTVNTAQRAWPVNLFLQLNCVVQPLLSYTPLRRTTVDWVLLIPIESSSGSGRVTTSTTFLGIAPGVYLEPSPSSVLLAGVRIVKDVSGTAKKPDTVVMPFVQFGLRIGM